MKNFLGNPIIVFLLLIVFPPLGIFLMFQFTNWKMGWKMFFAVICSIIFIVAIIVSINQEARNMAENMCTILQKL